MAGGSGWDAPSSLKEQGKGRGEQMLGELGSAPCPSAPHPMICRQIGGKGGHLAWGVRQGQQPLAAGLGCVVTWRAVASTARPVTATAASPACRAPGLSGCHIPAMALPSHDLGQVWAEVEQGGWELGRGSCSFDAQLWGQGAWAHSLLLPLPPSLFCCYLYLGLCLAFPTSSSMGKRRCPLILSPTIKHRCLSPCKQCGGGQLVPPELPLGQAGRAGHAATPVFGAPVVPHSPRPW